LRGIDLEGGDDSDDRGLGEIIDRTEGVTASFIKEMVRRAVLRAAEARGDGERLRLTQDDLHAALDDLIEHSAPVLRSSLGVNPHLADLADLGDLGEAGAFPDAVGGWVAFAEGSRTYLSAYHDDEE
jgi:hypothetical protein